MLEAERKIVDRFSPELKSDVIPCDTLPYLPCLTEDDREQIERKQDREGPRAAVPILLDRLKKRPDSFGQLLDALESTGCQHLKKLLLEALSESPQLPETTKTTPSTEKITSPPLESKPKPPPTPSQETDLSQFPNSPSQETDCSEFPTSPSKEEAPSSQENEISPRRSQESDDPEYDIFVCYSHKDRDVAFELKNVMTKEFNLQVCIDEVDFIPGNAISNNICDCIRCSKAIVFLLTPDFLDKKWAPWEMQQALHDLLDNKRTKKKIVPVLLKPCVVPIELRPYSPLTFQESSTASKTENWKRLAAAVQGRRTSGRSVIVEKFNKLWKL